MSKASVITVVLIDGDPDGRRSACFGNDLPKVYAFPKGQLGNVISEICKPGVYLIYGSDPQTGKSKVYIGESINAAERLSYHKGNSKEPKEYWEDTAVLISQTDSLTKAHVGYIEAKLIAAALNNINWEVGNDKLTSGKAPQAATLPLADTINMEHFVDQAKTLIRTLGCDLFKATTGHLVQEMMGASSDPSAFSPDFRFSGADFDAKAVVASVSGDWIVKAQSTAKLAASESLSNGIKQLRGQLQKAGKLKEVGGRLVFQEDCLFKSASTAASLVCGSPKDGKNKAWKLADGTTYGEWESVQAPGG